MKKWLAILALLLTLVPQLLAAEKSSRPNIVFLLADDLGIDGINCYGSDRFKNKTPNIDALASSGIRFTRCYSAPLCGPSRCQIMTGRYGFRTGGFSNQAAHVPSAHDEPSLAKTLKQAGYATGMAGKWRQMGESPGDWGFDEFVTDNTASGWYWEKTYNKGGTQVQKDTEVYCPDVCLDFAKDFFKRHASQPFYFYYPTHLVHGPILRTPESKPGTTEREALYNDNLDYLDKHIGRLVSELDKLDLRQKTVILFSIDNGTAQRSFTIGGRQINGSKGTMLEGGVRVPLLVSWKGVTPEARVLDDLVDFSDFYPTFADLAGVKMPDKFKFDGKSFASQIRGEKAKPRDWVYVQLNRNYYVRNDGWKLNQSGELFDMSDSPFVEKLISTSDETPQAKTARKTLASVLAELNPAGGKMPSADSIASEKKARKQRKQSQKAADSK